MVFPAVNSQILTIGVFIGIVVSMIFYERELLSPGGVVVPGYTALFLITNPIIVVYTLLIALLTGLIIKKASRISILFGRRRFAVTMLLALSLSVAAQSPVWPAGWAVPLPLYWPLFVSGVPGYRNHHPWAHSE